MSRLLWISKRRVAVDCYFLIIGKSSAKCELAVAIKVKEMFLSI